jgi:glyoxylate/hydroxypyruvate reductase A
LLSVLESGQLAGAALDVFGIEPLPGAHPFWRHPKIVVTPHDACEVRLEAVTETLLATADAIKAGRRPPFAIDRDRGY